MVSNRKISELSYDDILIVIQKYQHDYLWFTCNKSIATFFLYSNIHQYNCFILYKSIYYFFSKIISTKDTGFA